jgi:hypothetical protein
MARERWLADGVSAQLFSGGPISLAFSCADQADRAIPTILPTSLLPGLF